MIDLCSRRLLGSPTSAHPDADLAGQAITMAIATRGGTVAGVIFHSDRGSTYTANDFTTLCTILDIRQSMGRVGSCFGCETVLRRSSRCDPCYDWPCGCPGVDLSAGSSGMSEVARRAGSDLIGA